MTELKLRRVEVLRECIWTTCRLHEVKRGETFRMYEGLGGEEFIEKGRKEFVALEDGWTNENGVGTVLVDD